MTAFSPATVSSEVVVPFTVTGSNFGPIGGAATVRLTATSGTPFLGGTTAQRELVARIDSPTRMSGVTREFGAVDAASTRVTAVLPDGRQGTSAGALAMIQPPRLAAVDPSVIRSYLTHRLHLDGTGFGARNMDMTIRFTARSGTPFLGQSSATLDVSPAAPREETRIWLETPWGAASTDFVADVTGLWLSGARGDLPAAVHFRPELRLQNGVGFTGSEGGTSVAISADYAVVGRPRGSPSGSADVYIRTGEDWGYQITLVPGDGGVGGAFASAVAISGDTIVVGRPDSGGGTVYVYVRNGVVWQQQQRIRPFDGATGDRFGASVAIEDDFVIVGAPGGGVAGGSGQAWSFTRSGTIWSEEHRFQLSTLNAWDVGASVAIGPALNSMYVYIGAPGGTDPSGSDPATNWNTGSVVVYARVFGSWLLRTWFHSESALNGAEFGASLAVVGGTLVVGAPGDKLGLTQVDAGAVYPYEEDQTNRGTWDELPRISSPSSVVGGRFGTSLALSDEFLVVGAPGENGLTSTSGAGHVYEWRGASLSHAVKVMSSNGASGDLYGVSVGVAERRILVGAPGNADLGNEAGQAYIH